MKKDDIEYLLKLALKKITHGKVSLEQKKIYLKMINDMKMIIIAKGGK